MKEFSKNQSTWKTMPATMIRKTAIVNALRETFPDTLGGMYTEDDNLKTDSHAQTEKHDVTPKEEKAQALVKQALKAEEPEQKQVEEKEEQDNEQGELLDHFGMPIDGE